jgi:hypothetical protein
MNTVQMKIIRMLISDPCLTTEQISEQLELEGIHLSGLATSSIRSMFLDCVVVLSDVGAINPSFVSRLPSFIRRQYKVSPAQLSKIQTVDAFLRETLSDGPLCQLNRYMKQELNKGLLLHSCVHLRND